MQLVIQPGGIVHCLYGEEIDLQKIGSTECVKIFETNFLKITEIHGGPLSC